MKIKNRRYLKTITPSVHAATMDFFNGNPVFAFFGGSREGNPDVSIFINNLKGNDELIQVGDKDMMPRWNPILFSYEDKLLLFEKSGTFCDRWTTFVHNITNWDENISAKEMYSTAQMLPAGLNGPVKNRPLLYKDTLICGSSVETVYDWTSYMESYSLTNGILSYKERTRPLGVKDKRFYNEPNTGRTLMTKGIIQPTIWFDNDKSGEANALFRSCGHNPYLYYSVGCADSGYWRDPVPTNIPNPNSGVSVATVGNRIFLAYNPSEINRIPLCISEIEIVDRKQERVEFKCIDTLLISEKVDSSFPMNSGELSYPYLIENNGKLHLVYTAGRVAIEYVTIEV